METPKRWWERPENLRVAQIILVGLAVGVTLRWMNAVAPPLPVLAAEQTRSATPTNSPAAFKIEGASPSARD